MRVLWPVYNLHEEQNQFLGIMVISSLLKEAGFGVEVVPASYDVIAGRLTEPEEPTVLAFSTPTPYAAHYLKLNQNLKRRFPEAYTVFGGPHPTYFPEMVESEGVDAVCIGEGEEAMLELVRGLAAGEPVSGVRNLWVRDGATTHRNPVRPLIEDLDTLPLPDHSLFRDAMPAGLSQTPVMTSRGCPYHCTYCYNKMYHDINRGKGSVVRRRSVDHVMEELSVVKAHGFRLVRFVDDLFILQPDWVTTFCERYAAEIGVPFTCEVRADHVTEGIIRTLRSAGCVRVMMGVEAGHDQVRTSILNRRLTKESMVHAAEIIRSQGLRLVTANIIGIPGGSSETDWETLELNVRCRPRLASVSFMQPYPRTEIYRIALEKGVFDDASLKAVEGSFGVGSAPTINFTTPMEKRMISNLQKFFQLGVWFPVLLPVIRRLVKMPPNRLLTFFYHCIVNWALSFLTIPPRIGLPMLWRKIRLKRRFKASMSTEPSEHAAACELS